MAPTLAKVAQNTRPVDRVRYQALFVFEMLDADKDGEFCKGKNSSTISVLSGKKGTLHHWTLRLQAGYSLRRCSIFWNIVTHVLPGTPNWRACRCIPIVHVMHNDMITLLNML
jgi:hypothetical protein